MWLITFSFACNAIRVVDCSLRYKSALYPVGRIQWSPLVCPGSLSKHSKKLGPKDIKSLKPTRVMRQSSLPIRMHQKTFPAIAERLEWLDLSKDVCGRLCPQCLCRIMQTYSEAGESSSIRQIISTRCLGQ